VSEKYDSVMNLGVAKLSARHTYLVDPNGVVRKVWTTVDVKTHSDDVLASLDELQENRPAESVNKTGGGFRAPGCAKVSEPFSFGGYGHETQRFFCPCWRWEFWHSDWRCELERQKTETVSYKSGDENGERLSGAAGWRGASTRRSS